jgi:uncharacterized membrane protein
MDITLLAKRFFGSDVDTLGDGERRILEQLAQRRGIARDTNREFDKGADFGDRLADKVARFGGSWTFIILFVGVLIVWTLGNALLAGKAFNSHPFIFLNLMLSMVAALQAPVIMMSQNRQAQKDRAAAANDYEVNLKAEIEIMHLHDKLEDVRICEIKQILAQQQKQIELLERLLASRSPTT